MDFFRKNCGNFHSLLPFNLPQDLSQTAYFRKHFLVCVSTGALLNPLDANQSKTFRGAQAQNGKRQSVTTHPPMLWARHGWGKCFSLTKCYFIGRPKPVLYVQLSVVCLSASLYPISKWPVPQPLLALWLFIYLSIYLPTYLSIYLSIYISIQSILF